MTEHPADPHGFDQLDWHELARKRSVKWARDPDDVLAVWVADMDFPIAAPIRSAMQALLDGDDVGYPGYALRDAVRRTFAERMQARFEWSIDWEDTWMLSTVVQGLHVAMTLASKPGDGVLVQTPIYPPFLAGIEALGRTLVDAPLGQTEDGRYFVDEGLMEDAIAQTPNTRVLLLCNPHNPTGRVFTADELDIIARVAERHNLTVVADEIHQDLLYPGQSHRVFAEHAPHLAGQTITITAASKAFNLAGNRCAIMHWGNPAHKAAFHEQYTHRLFGEVSLMGHVATLAAWTDPASADWLRDLMVYLDGNRAWLADALAERLPLARHTSPEGTYLAWVDMRAYDVGDDPSETLMERARVAVGCGPDFGPRGNGFMRLNMATSRSILELAVDRIANAVTPV